MAFLSGMLALMALRQILTMISERGSWAIVFHWHTAELPGLAVSILAFLAVFYLKDMITEHDQAVENRNKSEKHMAKVLSIAEDAIITIDEDQRILEFNWGAEQIFGYHAKKVLGQSLNVLLPPRFAKVHQQHIRAFATAPKSTRRMGELSQEIFGQRKDGSEFPADASISKLSMDNQITFTVILRDITKMRQSEAEIKRLALYDTLTQLPNRSFLHKLLQRKIDSTGPKTTIALLFMGVDRFKAINETLGHPVGNHVLQKIAKRLQQFSDQSIYIARLGGDVFAMVLTPLADTEQPLGIAHEILEIFSSPLMLEGYTIDIEMSIGIALYPDHGENADALMDITEVAMAAAKSTHSRITIYDTGMEQYTLEHLQLAGELRRAIEQNELILYYQPKIDMDENRVIGVEALVRWQHPEKGFMAPDLFIPMAEQTGLIHPLTYWVLNEAFAQTKRWRQQGLELTMAVNLAVQDLLDAQLVDMIAKGLRCYEIEPSWLMLEITEGSLMADPVRAQRTLQQLHTLGIRLSIDDFGTGHSSLAYLKDLPVHELKIDQSFVLNMPSDETQAMIVRSIINLAHNLGLTTTAEGVETQTVWNQLRALGCNVAQGYFMSRPLTETDFMQWLKESEWGVGG